MYDYIYSDNRFIVQRLGETILSVPKEETAHKLSECLNFAYNQGIERCLVDASKAIDLQKKGFVDVPPNTEDYRQLKQLFPAGLFFLKMDHHELGKTRFYDVDGSVILEKSL